MEIFQFKKFKIRQNSASVFKVNTEAVLLSAWVKLIPNSDILEIGSGTGVISLGLKQRLDSDSKITSIDLDPNAYELTLENVKLNDFQNVYPVHMGLQEYFNENSTRKFDLIISNPPYFDTQWKSIKPRNVYAKYTDSLDYQTLIIISSNLLKEDGRIALVIPFQDLKKMEAILDENECQIIRRLDLFSVSNKSPLRVLIEIVKRQGQNKFEKETLVIKDQLGNFTSDYIAYTKDYYTIF